MEQMKVLLTFLLNRSRHEKVFIKEYEIVPMILLKSMVLSSLSFFNVGKVIVSRLMLQAMYDCLNNLHHLGNSYISQSIIRSSA